MLEHHINCVIVVCEYLEEKEVDRYLVASGNQSLLNYMCIKFVEKNNEVSPYYEVKQSKKYMRSMIRYVTNIESTEHLSEYKNAKYLKFNHYFDEPINKNMYSDTVEDIIFGISFDQPIDENTFSSNIKHITFGWHFKQALTPGCLPSNLETLTIISQTPLQINDDTLPDTLEEITIIQSGSHALCLQQKQFPKKLKKACITGSQKIDMSTYNLNDELESLTLNSQNIICTMNQYLPPSLKMLKVRNNNNIADYIRTTYPQIKLIIIK